MQKILSSIIFTAIVSSNAAAFEKGFNQGWIVNRYGTQWVSGFDREEFARNMDLTRAAGGTILRYWLFEGHHSDAIDWSEAGPERLSPDFLRNLRIVLRLAKEKGVRLNLTLLDGNMGQHRGPSQALHDWWWNLLNERFDARRRFVEKIWEPLLEVLAEPEFSGVVLQLDLVNEINALVRKASPLRFEAGWPGANRFICELRNARDRIAPGILPLTASVGWNSAETLILNGSLYPHCVDYFDIHVYDNAGEIPRCRDLVAYASSRGKKIQLGEFGQSLPFYSDTTQTASTRSFLKNAEACGMSAALAWRLAEIESKAYLTFERSGRLRPAYDAFRKAGGGEGLLPNLR